MPLPALDLDTRQWADLVDEARALVPRLAPAWTDHNVHDPGITLIELLAYLVEQDIYRVGRVPERHRRKFLRLIGFPPEPARATRGAVCFRLRPGAAAADLPAGITVGTADLPFRTVAALRVSEATIAAVQSWDGSAFADVTRPWREGQPFAALGASPSAADVPALLLGFDPRPVVGETVSLCLSFDGHVAHDREMLEREVGAARALEHHSLRTVWEYHDGADWQALDPDQGEVVDETRAFSLDGSVRITLPTAMGPVQVGAVEPPLGYLRCRVASGEPDATPVVRALALNAVAVEQRKAFRQTFTLAPGPPLPAGQAPVPGNRAPLALQVDDDGIVTSLVVGDAGNGPNVLVLDYRPSAPTVAGSLTVTVGIVGRGEGLPGQCLELPEVQAADGLVELWTDERWQQVDDLDGLARTDASFWFEPRASVVCFGDGERGRVAPAGAAVFGVYDVTRGAGGTTPDTWRIAGVDDLWNAAVAGTDPAQLEAALEVTPAGAPVPGADPETLTSAQGRAAAAVWAHERLLELCPPGAPQTLDQVARARVLERVEPERAATCLDFERLALRMPGVDVRRARAWAGVDPRDPCLHAPGTVTVVVLTGMPAAHPTPSAGALAAVARFLDRRRLIGTRLRVVGPAYVDVTVEASVQAARGAASGSLGADIRSAIDSFFDPLTGGPGGFGWPFGRDVYRTEVLERIAGVPGVDHVLELTIRSGDEAGGCDNICVGPAALVRAGEHTIEVEPA